MTAACIFNGDIYPEKGDVIASTMQRCHNSIVQKSHPHSNTGNGAFSYGTLLRLPYAKNIFSTTMAWDTTYVYMLYITEQTVP